MRDVGILFLCIFVFIGATLTVQAQDTDAVPEDILLKVSYCACKCCEKKKDCLPHHSMPKDFKCKKSQCNEEFCEYWEQAKCSKDCFCKECKKKLLNDYRCMDFTSLPASCKKHCEEDYDCSIDDETKKINLETKEFFKNSKDETCNIPCFCKMCHDSLPKQIYPDCARASGPKESCKCDKMGIECPHVEDTKQTKKKSKSKTDKAKEILDDDETKCKFQCYCEKCAKQSAKLKESCKKLTKTSNCDCVKRNDDIHCPTEEQVDSFNEAAAICKVSCFCKQCKRDKRMTETMLKSCEQYKTVPEGCDGCKKEDCNLLDRISEDEENMKKDEL